MYKLNVISHIILTTYTGAAYASTGLPQEDKVVVGKATFGNKTSADKMTINQESDKVQINWKSFDIGKGQEKWNLNNPPQILWHITV